MGKIVVWFVALTGAAFFIQHADSRACMTVGAIGQFNDSNSDQVKPFGEEIRRGLSIAAAELRKDGKCVTLRYIDIKGSISNVGGAVEQATLSGVRHFIGLGSSDQATASLNALKRTKSILLTPTASNERLIVPNSPVIMINPNNGEIARSAAATIRLSRGAKVYSIYTVENTYSADMHAAFVRAFGRKGTVVKSIRLRTASMTYDDAMAIARIKDGDFVFLPLYELDAAKVIADLMRRGTNPTFIGADSWGTYSKILRRLIATKPLKAIVPITYDVRGQSAPNRRFVGAYRARWSDSPTDLAAFSYDALILLSKIKRKCPFDALADSPAMCLRAAMPFDSTTGTITATTRSSLGRHVTWRSF